MAEASPLQKFSLQDVQEHADRKSPWLIIHDKVYDVTDWLEEHPGGEEVLLDTAGKDASECFEDIGHSTDARNRMKEYLIGELRDEDKTGSKEQDAPKWVAPNIVHDNSSSLDTWLVWTALALTAWLVFQLF